MMAADERSTIATLDAAREVFRLLVAQHLGRVVDAAGDSTNAPRVGCTSAYTVSVNVLRAHDAGN
jgi:hypothetical protein